VAQHHRYAGRPKTTRSARASGYNRNRGRRSQSLMNRVAPGGADPVGDWTAPRFVVSADRLTCPRIEGTTGAASIRGRQDVEGGKKRTTSLTRSLERVWSKWCNTPSKEMSNARGSPGPNAIQHNGGKLLFGSVVLEGAMEITSVTPPGW